MIALIPMVFYLTQLLVDLGATKFADAIGYRTCVVASQVVSAAGLILMAFLPDTGAYFAGRAFGKHKLAPKVSPKKTVEGAIGGVVFCTLSFVVFGLLYNRFWLADGDEAIPLLAMAIVGFIVSIVSQIGGLSLSLLKRKYGIKDFGKIFPGHGGVLDRFDSVLAVSIILTVSFVFLTALGI